MYSQLPSDVVGGGSGYGNAAVLGKAAGSSSHDITTPDGLARL
jgi:hypothetical protein